MRRIVVLALVVLASATTGMGAEAITFENYADGTTIRYPVPLIRGTLTDKALTEVTVTNESSRRDTRTIKAMARKGRFVALTELVPGPNKLVLTVGKASRRLTINYTPQTNPYVVRVFLMTGKDGDETFQSQRTGDKSDYRGKLATAMLVMQTFTAERMNDSGHGRVTFNLEFDKAGRVVVHTLKGPHTADEYRTLTGNKLFGHAAWLIRRRFPHATARNLVIPAFSRFDPKTRKTLAHTALGGGAYALFGGANVFTWPDRLADVQKAFSDTTRIDGKRFQDDSVGRSTFWGAASTTLGAALHEVGHTFGLPHSSHPHDIMTRGHDRLNRVFTLVEPPHARRKTPYEFKPNEVALWYPASAAWLKHSRWFALDARDYAKGSPPSVTYDPKSAKITIEAAGGIAAIVLGVPKRAIVPVGIDTSKGVPLKLMLDPAGLPRPLQVEELAVRVMDRQGVGKVVTIKRTVPPKPPAAKQAQ